MLQNLKPLYGRKLGAADGDVGRVKDFYLDDRSWVVRYLEADADSWLPSRRLLFTLQAFGFRSFGISPDEPAVLRVGLNRKKVEDSPFIEGAGAPTREDEEAYYAYYGLQAYWRPANVKGAPAFPARVLPSGRVGMPEASHLHPTKAMTGYQVCATDGPVGRVLDLRIDKKTWGLMEIVVETGAWYASKKIVICPASVARIDHAVHGIFVNLARRDIRHTMRNDVAVSGAGAGAGYRELCKV
jgi:hypothetical protein